jgi:DNA-3-methyladenine glycosylase I
MTSKNRCRWAGDDPLYQQYHDREWGVPNADDDSLFEFLILEGAQAGLAWITVLRKREGYRKAFDDFDARKISRYSDKKIEKLLENPDIIRNRLKVKSARSNAKAFLAVQNEFGSFAYYLWNHVDFKPLQNQCQSMSEVPAETELSRAISKDMKKRGFNFVGPTIIYAFMQATGMVNDHTTDCFRHQQCVNKGKREIPLK